VCLNHLDLIHVVLFCQHAYISSTETGQKFFTENAKYVQSLVVKPVGRRLRVLDIASNDGSQLDCYGNEVETYGVDPAEELSTVSRSKGHKIYCQFWNRDLAQQLPEMDIITAQNVFGQSLIPKDFLEACKLIMHSQTDLYIQTSQSSMILNGQFDNLYHEHLSFFSVSSMKALVERVGLVLQNVRYHPIHGVSSIFHIRKTYLPDFPSAVEKLLAKEKENNLHCMRGYEVFTEKVDSTISLTQKKVHEFETHGYTIVGYGAAAKAMTFLGASNLKLEYIIDENPWKIGKFCLGQIPVFGPNHLHQDSRKLFIIILAWNFAEEIEKKIRMLRKSSEDVVFCYFPEVLLSWMA